jgi:hypothetical protein
MNPQTGEIKLFETEIPEGWVGLQHLQEGKEITLHGLRFKIIESKIEIGKPGKIELKLEGMAVDPIQEAFGNLPSTGYNQNFRDSLKAFKERNKKKEWE